MNVINEYALRAFRKVYQKIFVTKQPHNFGVTDPDKASDMIYDLLVSGKPCMIARFGSTEMLAIMNYLGVCRQEHSIVKYLKGEYTGWWWNRNIMNQMQQCSGFFPPTPDNMMRFGKMMLEDAKEIDILGSWIPSEKYISEYVQQAVKVHLLLLEPFWSEKPWTNVLEGKKVLVVHPFSKTIERQYVEKRMKLFENTSVLPKFELITIQAVQSIGGEDNGFCDWFDALSLPKKGLL